MPLPRLKFEILTLFIYLIYFASAGALSVEDRKLAARMLRGIMVAMNEHPQVNRENAPDIYEVMQRALSKILHFGDR